MLHERRGAARVRDDHHAVEERKRRRNPVSEAHSIKRGVKPVGGPADGLG